jgi:uncharacterized protein (DUF1810 family)
MPTSSDPFDLERFRSAQRGVIESAIAEVRNGRKTGHWMWFVFPQIAGLGSSSMSRKYAIHSIEEARAYLGEPVLGSRLLAAATAVLGNPGRDPVGILGDIDARKLRSSMTLFHRADPDQPVFRDVLDRFFGGATDPETDRLIGR